MKSWLKLCGQGARFCASCALTCGCWTLWLFLVLLLAAQVGIAVSHELAVPRFLLRSLEERLAVSQIHTTFGRATFDPSGSIVIKDMRISLPGLGEPVARVRAAFVELDPWALLAGRFSPRVLRATGASLYVPAMLSRSGRTEEIIDDLEFTCRPQGQELRIEHLTAHVAGIAVTAQGTLRLNVRMATGAAPQPIADFIARTYPDICRRVIAVREQLAAFDRPVLQAELIASETRGAIAAITVRSSEVKLSAPWAVQATGFSASTRVPLLGAAATMAPLDLQVDEVTVAGVTVSGAQARIHGELLPASFSFQPRTVELTVDSVSSRGFDLTALSAQLKTDALPKIEIELQTLCAGEPVALRGHADLKQQEGALRFDGALAPAMLIPISEQIGHDVRRFVDFAEPVQLRADVAFAGGWKFTRLAGQVAARKIDAYHVPIDSAHGDIEFDGRHFVARHAKASLGGNFARGSFEQDLSTREFRFLLEGQLRPLAISGWFHNWWPDFFGHFEFPVAAPDASVDVAGWWGSGVKTTVFVFAEAASPLVRGAKFDYARTILFIRPNYFDDQELFATQGLGEVRGTFVRTVDYETGLWSSLDFDLRSSVDLGVASQIFGAAATDWIAPFSFENPPLLKLAGHLDGPETPGGGHRDVTIEAQSAGQFSLHDFPLHNLAFHAVLHDDELKVDRVNARWADGVVTGQTRVWGSGADRRISFDGSLSGASLAQAIAAAGEYSAKRKGRPPPPPGRFLQQKASVKLDLSAAAEGRYEDMLSFKGRGSAVLSGPGLGEVQLLGLLSQLLNFTSLRFTAARANFKIEGSKLVFPDIKVTGANSAIEAHGDYALDRDALDFNARVYPFRESRFFLQNVVGAMLSPLSTVLEVKLTGSLDKPAWSFVIGPTNFFRSLLQSPPPSLAPPAPSPAPSPAPLPPEYYRKP